ncbi:hypothetical protein AWB74_07695 [Caballeronia arvi]|uniref:DUF1574 domain-containing protein n=1 Tax=Caballeronia arvi TaxID=1777135 RepID=A0A158L0P2_9BURK|nr:hypothetical protein [Caballeronia arvi]SAL86420.1 hypothetical protein AWB74_07695 [Caballeronia arvi]
MVVNPARASTASPTSLASPRVDANRKEGFIIRLALFLALSVLVWLGLWAAWRAVPFVRPGSDLISEAKFERLSRQALFNSGDKMRVLVFGNSKTMAGFRPALFDSLMGPHVRSVNLAIPGDSRFLPVLKAALEAGNRPTHIVLTEPWDALQQPPGVLARLTDDAALANAIAPFRQFPRDLTLFVFQSHLRVTAEYRRARDEAEQMLRDRGWYFIKSQSHYAHDQLPSGYHLPTDLPNKLYERELVDRSLVHDELFALARQYDFTIIFVPLNRRVGQSAPPPAADARRVKTISRHPHVVVIGPDYYTYPAPSFADPVHLNPEGSVHYTQDLAQLFRSTGAFD